MAKPRRVSLWAVLLAAFAIVVSCALYINRITRHTELISAEAAMAEQTLAVLKTEQGAMEAELARKDTDEYYTEIARNQYGMIQKGEYRIKITNPEIFDEPDDDAP